MQPGRLVAGSRYVVRTADARALAADLRQIVSTIDSKRAIFGLRALNEVVDAAFDQPKLDAAMLGSFASAALALAGIGLYSLFMLVVSDRRREIAVRLAIGASPGEMIRLITVAAGRLLAGGIVLGIVLTAAADRVLGVEYCSASPRSMPQHWPHPQR